MHRITLLLSAGLLVLFAGCGGDSAAPNAGVSTSVVLHESPEAAFKAFQAAIEEKEWEQAANCMTSDAQSAIAMLLTIPVSMMAAFDEAKQPEIEALLAKHGLNVNEGPPGGSGADQATAVRAFGKQIKDKPAFIAELIEWLDKNDDDADGDSVFSAMGDGDLGDVKINGDAATAVLTFVENGRTETQPMEFKKENGGWLLHATEDELQMGGSSSASSNMPDFGESGGFKSSGNFGSFGGDVKPEQPIEAVSLEQFNSTWQTSLNADGQPAVALLKQLADELELKLQFDGDLDAQLNKPVGINLRDRSRLEIIEAICREVKVYPDYSDQTLVLQSGLRPFPVTFTGPLLIEVRNVSQNSKYATGVLDLRLFATGLPETVVEKMNKQFGSDTIAITRIEDAEGNSLMKRYRGGIGFNSAPTSTFDRTMQQGLKNLLRLVTTLSIVDGVVQLSVPSKVAVLKFDKLQAGAEKTSGDIRLKLQSASPQAVSVEFEGADLDQIQLLAYDAAGKRLDVIGTGGFGGGNSGMKSLQIQGQAQTLEARVVTQSDELSYEFTFKNIPLPNFAQAPEKLASLEFEGESPLTLQFVRIGGKPNFRRVIFNVTNHTNKDVQSLSIQMHFLDANGNELEKSSTTIGSAPIESGKQTEVEATAFFMPDETKTATATVTKVEFADASEWDMRKAGR